MYLLFTLPHTPIHPLATAATILPPATLISLPFLGHTPASGLLHVLVPLPLVILPHLVTHLPPLPLSGHSCHLLNKAYPDQSKISNIFPVFPNFLLCFIDLFIQYYIYFHF